MGQTLLSTWIQPRAHRTTSKSGLFHTIAPGTRQIVNTCCCCCTVRTTREQTHLPLELVDVSDLRPDVTAPGRVVHSLQDIVENLHEPNNTTAGARARACVRWCLCWVEWELRDSIRRSIASSSHVITNTYPITYPGFGTARHLCCPTEIQPRGEGGGGH